ncbi:acetyl-CoA acetyltransferase [Desulfuromonas soudanensis]|uniref:Acetyl-CoA acetyltransferase n=1 Tax=Desulfuromonas soudanensis TaxID=1603606 RepID=A0A0M4CXU8_9BACT|nr:acetyl-CoA C-acyltransferase [Desulfuromonas soudanensis]ALC15102.1 acetyl-CoA acetyltransferase [Desulfuromonas soudanensis]
MENVYVVEALRTPFGSFGGTLADVPAARLGAAVIAGLLERSGVAPEEIGQVIAGQVLSGGAGQAPARQAMRYAGIPDQIPALTINKVCGSGLKAIMLGADAIRLGDSETVIAGGMENMSMAPYALPSARFGLRLGKGEAVDLLVHDALTDPYSGRHMGEIAEARVIAHGLTREAQDAFAGESYRRAQLAQTSGVFKGETVAVVKASRKGDLTVDQDEEPFRGDIAKLGSLRPAFDKNGTLTAGNASSINDGAAFALLAGEKAVKRLGLKPKARLVAYATNSLPPDLFPDAPVGAIERACAKAGLTTADIGLWEINEAFAAVTMIAIKELGLDPQKVNVNGGACALGHPVGASGARLVATLVAEMQRRGERYGLATLCIGGGEAVAAIFERV